MILGEPLRVLGSGPPRTGRLERTADGSVALLPDDRPYGELCVGPGWVDLHAHVYDGMTSLGVPPDDVGRVTGVHVVADAGSAGAETLDGLVKYVIPAATVRVRAWVNIGSSGLVHLRETADLANIDVDATLAAIERHRDVVCGVKVRSSGLIVGAMGLQPLQLGRLVAREAGLPLLVHVGEPPPLIEDVLDLLDDGDSVTHCYHPKTGHPWRPDGRPVPALERALERGVLLDVGHGAASFGFEVASRAIAAGYPPHTISTDAHIRNIGGPVHDLATTMTKLLACGLPLDAVVAAVTDHPRAVLRTPEPWLGAGGAVRHATVFRMTADPPPSVAPPHRIYRDALGVERRPASYVVPLGTITDSRLTANQ
ncbi:MAG: amidohydrolase/deacetylase family metallohydrolase [Actinoallomurus sp.]